MACDMWEHRKVDHLLGLVARIVPIVATDHSVKACPACSEAPLGTTRTPIAGRGSWLEGLALSRSDQGVELVGVAEGAQVVVRSRIAPLAPLGHLRARARVQAASGPPTINGHAQLGTHATGRVVALCVPGGPRRGCPGFRS